MDVILPSYEILTPISKGGIKELKEIEQIGRVCYKSENKISFDGESAKKFVAMLIRNGHEAMLEHSTLSVKFTVDRGVSHELVRHRIASFAQESTRYCNYANGKFNNEITLIYPGKAMKIDSKVNQLTEAQINEIIFEWDDAMRDAEDHYLRMIELGATPQMARSVLPNSLKTEIVLTANYREWRNIFKLRCAPDAHPQMREIMVPLLEELQELIPIVFDDCMKKKRE